MKISKKKKLESKGWKVGTAHEFLGLTKKESNKIEQHPIRYKMNVTRLRPTPEKEPGSPKYDDLNRACNCLRWLPRF